MKKLIILLIATMLFTTKVYGIKSRNLVGGIEARDCNYCFLSEINSQKLKKANNIEDIAAKNCTILLIVNDIAILYSTYILYKYCFLII